MQKFKEIDNGNPDGTAKNALAGITPGTNYKAEVWNDNLFNLFLYVENAGYTLIDDDLSQLVKANKGLYRSTFTYNTSAIATQSVNDIVLGSDNIYYEAQNDGIIGDNPVGSITGKWKVSDFQDSRNTSTLTTLRALTVPQDRIFVTGHTTANDGAFGSLYWEWNSASTESDDDGTIIKLTSITTGRYELRFTGAICGAFFGAFGNGASDNGELQKAVDYVKANGGKLKLEGRTYLTKGINLSGGVKKFSIVGSDMDSTLLTREDDTVGTVMEGAASNVGITIKDLSIDCNNATHANGNHGIAISDTSDVLVQNVKVFNYKNSGIILFSNTNIGKENNRILNCEVDGLGVANNGMLIGNLDYCKMIGSTARGIVGSPGYGLQFKNETRYSVMGDCIAEGCDVGLAFGQEGNVQSVEKCTVSNITIDNSNNKAIEMGYAVNNHLSGINIDMLGGILEGVVLSNCDANSLSFNIANMPALKYAVKLEDSDSNAIEITQMSGCDLLMDVRGTSNNNIVRLVNSSNPKLPLTPTDYTDLIIDTSDNNTNIVRVVDQKLIKPLVMSGSAITVDAWVDDVLIDTSGGALENLTDINGVFKNGRVLTFRTTSNTRDINFVNNIAKIALSGGVDFTLLKSESTLTLQYNETDGYWQEISRSVNHI